MVYSVKNSAIVEGEISIGKDSRISYGTYVYSEDNSVSLSNNSMILENSYVYGTKKHPVKIGQKTVFGHRCKIIGAEVGNFCEIGNGTFIDEGAVVGDYCIMGEGTYLPKTAKIPSYSVVIGNPYRILRGLDENDKKMISTMRGNKMDLTEEELHKVKDFNNKNLIEHIIPFKEFTPSVGDSTLEEEVELIGKVTIGDNCLIKKGVKIIGDSHGTVTIGNNVIIGEDTVIHLLPNNNVEIKDNVKIGKDSIVHGCILEENVVIEDNVIVCDNSHIGKGTRVGKNSIVPQRKTLDENLTVSGNPVK